MLVRFDIAQVVHHVTTRLGVAAYASLEVLPWLGKKAASDGDQLGAQCSSH